LFFEKNLTPHNGNKFFVVTKLEANFLGAAKLGDMIEVTTEVLDVKKVSIVLMQKIYKDETIIYTQKVKLAFLNNNKPSAIPKEQLAVLVGEN